MDAWQLRNFLMIVECGSITRAADRLGIAQPSLSQQLLRLEDEVGVPLFHRTSRGVAVTDAGRMFQEHALNILHAMQRAREEVRRHETEPKGDVSFALSASTSNLLGVPLLIAARRKFPLITLRLREAMSGAIRGWLEQRRIDLAILYDAEVARHLSVKHIADESLFFIGPAGEFGPVDDRGVALEPVSPDQVAAATVILPTVAHGLRRLVDRQTDAQDFDLKIDVEIDSLVHIRTLVAQRQGHSLLSHAAVSEDLTAGRLSAARIHGLDLRRSVSLVRNPTQEISQASVEIEDLALELMREMIDDGRWITEASTQSSWNRMFSDPPEESPD
ncbi:MULTISPECIES: LysR family transcriptional regulator [unclassified Phenylobacterium]|uniref:LysR family transcriptional regulator n=1 Tax=unclassified Phenylobacterium TaxID=2640670 RepID=UPI001A30700B|nr:MULTISPECIES: LysR family transcriptional regulator [unclassified Phenylobacterium]MBJ7411295.1 LysR family transcriptional regulator [Phenylobacterium sp.]MCR5879864.1 LysR family transcriptional regulator [Phenylobacterium sp. J367]